MTTAMKRNLFDRLERRQMLSAVVFDSHGHELGRTEWYEPAGGVHIATDAEMRRGRASGDGAPGFQIEVVFGSGLSASQQAAFVAGAARWETILLGDVPDVAGIDDVRINASGVAIDGPGNVLGSAGPNGFRNAANKFVPYQGNMQFDTADLASMEADGTLVSVIAHEMGHVLGVGTTWGSTRNNLLSGAGGANPVFTGAVATAEFSKMQGTLTQTSVPVENTGGSGTRDSHWRETTFANELMTGFISGATQPLSRLTAGGMIDIGYPLVDLEAADLFTRPANTLPTIGTLTAPTEVPIGGNLTLGLSSATDVSTIQFFRESNGFTGLQASGNITPDTIASTISSGLSTSFSLAGLASGTYTFHAVVKDAFNLQSAFRSVTVSIVDSVSVPSTPSLATASDLGSSDSDGLTSDNTPTFTGVGPTNQTIRLFNGETLLGSTAADGSGNWSFTAPELADGAYAIYAVAFDGLNSSSPSGTRSITIDTAAPAVLSTTYDRNLTQDVTITLGEALSTQITVGKLTLTNTTNGAIMGIASVTYGGGNTTARVSFSTPLLPNGRYTLTMPATGIHDAAGNALASAVTVEFAQVAGDANGDGATNFDDLLVLAQNYGGSGKTFSQGNFNYDGSGIVDFSDLLILAQNYGTALISSTTVSTATKRRTNMASSIV